MGGGGCRQGLQQFLREGRIAFKKAAYLPDQPLDAFGLQGYMNLTALHRLLRQERAISLVQLRIDPRSLGSVADEFVTEFGTRQIRIDQVER